MTEDPFEQLHRDLLAERFQPHREYRASAVEMAAREALAALCTGCPPGHSHPQRAVERSGVSLLRFEHRCDNGTGETGAVNSDPALTARTLDESEVRLRGT